MTQMYEFWDKPQLRAFLTAAYKEGSRIKETTREGYTGQLLSFCELVSNASSIVDPYIVLPDYPKVDGKPKKETSEGTPIRSLLDLTLEEVEDIAEEHTRRFDGGIVVDVSSRLPSDIAYYEDKKIRGQILSDIQLKGVSHHDGKTIRVLYTTYNPEEYRVAPKRLNQQVSALKLWLHINWRRAKSKLKNRRMFRQLHFDKESRLTSGLREERVTTEMVRNMFAMANGDDGTVIGFYALMAVRPSLIPAIKVKHLEKSQYTIEHGAFKFAVKPALLIVPNRDEKGRHLKGNKADFEYPAFIPTVICDKIELWINNAYETVTPEMPLTPADKKGDVDYVMKKYFTKVGFTGRNYMARKFGSDTVLKQMEYGEKGDTLLKETMCGHKKGVQQIYDILSGLSEDRIDEWRSLYENTVDKWINENVFNVRTTFEQKLAEQAKKMAVALGVDERQAKDLLRQFTDAQLDLDTLQNSYTRLIKREQTRNLEARVDAILSKRFPKSLPEPVAEDVDIDG